MSMCVSDARRKVHTICDPRTGLLTAPRRTAVTAVHMPHTRWTGRLVMLWRAQQVHNRAVGNRRAHGYG